MFVGPFEHHSNLLPWRESCAEVVTIGERTSGGLDLGELKDQLDRFAGRKPKIGESRVCSSCVCVFGSDALIEVRSAPDTGVVKSRRGEGRRRR